MDERSRVFDLAVRLVNPDSRQDELRLFCQWEQLQTILLFIMDHEVGAFLAAPGFPQTLPNGKIWRQLLAPGRVGLDCPLSVPWPTHDQFNPAALIAVSDYVLVIVGRPRNELLQAFRAALPLIGAALKGERAILSEAAQTKLARDTARQAHELALGLDKARTDAQRELSFRRAAEEQVRKRTAVLEMLNKTGAALAAELNRERIIRLVTEAGATITRSEFGGFLSLADHQPAANLKLSGLVGPGAAAFAAFATPAMLQEFRQSLQKGSVLRDSGCFCKHFSNANGNLLNTRSFLAAPVVSPAGDFLGGLLFGHSLSGAFTDDAEEVIHGLASAAGISIGNASLYEALNRELDEHRRAEAELQQIRHELEQRVKDRTASLEQAIAQMEEFSYSVSHDLRTPLRAMTGYADALLSDYSAQLDQTARTYLDRIKRASLRMERLTFDLLAYTRVARLESQTVVVDPAKVVADLLEHYACLQEPAATIRVEGKLPALLGHESAFGQVLSNLLTNAVKFVPEGKHPIVTITGENRQDFGRITIADNGIGVPPVDQARLFRMFERIHSKTNYEGSGIGLAIVRKAVEKMGGRVGVESDGQNGSRFWFELPLADRALSLGATGRLANAHA